MGKLGYKPNSNKHKIFKEFGKEKHPSELVMMKKYKIPYNTMMKYYEEWKICHRKKERFMQEIDNYFKMLERKGMGVEMQLHALIRRLDAKPMEWWYHKNTVKDVWSAA